MKKRMCSSVTIMILRSQILLVFTRELSGIGSITAEIASPSP
jgi:hypothetical protein